jgi:hypothetical protein
MMPTKPRMAIRYSRKTAYGFIGGCLRRRLWVRVGVGWNSAVEHRAPSALALRGPLAFLLHLSSARRRPV